MNTVARVLSWIATTVALGVLLIVAGCATYIRLGTTVIGDFVSPDGVHDAVLMVRNGGAASGYSTGISIVRAHAPLARELALLRGGMNVFVADDNDGAARMRCHPSRGESGGSTARWPVERGAHCP